LWQHLETDVCDSALEGSSLDAKLFNECEHIFVSDNAGSIHTERIEAEISLNRKILVEKNSDISLLILGDMHETKDGSATTRALEQFLCHGSICKTKLLLSKILAENLHVDRCVHVSHNDKPFVVALQKKGLDELAIKGDHELTSLISVCDGLVVLCVMSNVHLVESVVELLFFRGGGNGDRTSVELDGLLGKELLEDFICDKSATTLVFSDVVAQSLDEEFLHL